MAPFIAPSRRALGTDALLALSLQAGRTGTYGVVWVVRVPVGGTPATTSATNRTASGGAAVPSAVDDLQPDTGLLLTRERQELNARTSGRDHAYALLQHFDPAEPFLLLI